LSIAKHCSIGLRSGPVGRQVAQFSTGRLDGLAHVLDLVSGQVVHDDDIARLERRHQALPDIVGGSLVSALAFWFAASVPARAED
jgi:hypothetical protein